MDLNQINETMFMENMSENFIDKILSLIYKKYTAEEFSSSMIKSDDIQRTLSKFNLDFNFDLVTKTLTIFDKTGTTEKSICLMSNREYLRKLEEKYGKKRLY